MSTVSANPSSDRSSDSGRKPTKTRWSAPSAATAERGREIWKPPISTLPSITGLSRRFIGGDPIKRATKTFAGRANSVRGRVDLLQDAVEHHRDPVTHRHRLDLVVGDVDRGYAEPPLKRSDLRTRLHAKLRVEVRERLVHQEHLRVADDRTSHRDPLPLASRERPRLPLEVVLEVEDPGRLEHALRLSGFGTRAIFRAKLMLSATVMCG